MDLNPYMVNPFMNSCLMNPNSFLKNVCFHQWFSIFFMSRTPQNYITCNMAGPSSQNVFQGQPPRNKDFSEKHTLWIHIQTCARVLSILLFSRWKIADLQARSAALGAALRACRSAISKIVVNLKCLKAKVTKYVLGVNGLNL